MVNSQNLQIKALFERDYTAEQIASGLALNLDAVKLVIAGISGARNKASTFKERFGDVEELALSTLKEVCSNVGGNDSARVMAAKILLEKKESLNANVDFDYDAIAERLVKSKQVSSTPDEKPEEGKILQIA